MPKRAVHLNIDRMIFGKSYPLVHQILDRNVKQLGPTHRRYTHTQANAVLVLLASGGDANAVAAAEVHLFVDGLQTEGKKMLRKMLE